VSRITAAVDEAAFNLAYRTRENR